MQLKCKKDLCRVQRWCWDWKCQKRFGKFRAGDFSPDDAPWSGGLVEVDSVQIETLIGNNPLYTTWEIANILKISRLIKLLVKMKNVFFILWQKTMWTFWPTQYLVGMSTS